MGKEKPIANSTQPESAGGPSSINDQLAFALQSAELGMASEINEKALPELASKRPSLFNLIKLNAIGNRVEQLMSLSGLVQVNPEARAKIKAEVSRLMNDASETVNSWLENGETEENIQVPFLFGRDEAQSFDAAVELGLVNLINEINFPFLAAVHEDDVLRFKLLSIDNALQHWGMIEAGSEINPGFETGPKKESKLNAFANKKIVKLSEMKEALVTE